jgi:DNA polymerase-3 subunit beta
MKFSIARDDIHEAIQKIANVIPQRSTISMTQNILLNAEDNHVELVATDLEITMVTEVEAKVENKGSIAVPGRLINDIIRELPNVTLNFESDESFRLNFRSEFADDATRKGDYKVSGEDPAEFPQRPELNNFKEINISNQALRKLINKTIFACSTDELRPALTGVYFEIGDANFQTVATDGHRLALMKYSESKLPQENINAIISTRALNFAQRSLESDGDSIVKIGDKHALFQMDNTQLYARLIDEVYVEYQNVIPNEIKLEMLVDASQFYSSVKRVSLFSNPITSQVILKIYKDHIDIHAEDVDYGGQANESIPCEFNGEEEFVIGFNARYLQDMLRHADTKQIIMQLIRPDYAVLFKPQNLPEDEDQLMLLMPIRLDQT